MIPYSEEYIVVNQYPWWYWIKFVLNCFVMITACMTLVWVLITQNHILGTLRWLKRRFEEEDESKMRFPSGQSKQDTVE